MSVDASRSDAVRKVQGRAVESTASVRCACYAAWSELCASPHDLDPRPGLRERVGSWGSIGYASSMDALIGDYVDVPLEDLKRQFSGLFEIGSDGPVVPIREDLQTGQRAGTRESLVRFYEHFGYQLAQGFAWAPDHLSVELEFMHFLCYGEATADSDASSQQLAQIDFTERHLLRWVPDLARQVEKESAGSLYARVIAELAQFVAADREWQAGTIVATTV